jgi:hypothetical protein
MPVAIRLPEIGHWKAQVKCQAACPVQTDAGRFTHGRVGAAALIGMSLLLWIVVPTLIAGRRLARIDIA